MNNILELYPYQLNNCWVFDDPRTGLKEEAFVLGMSEIISKVVCHFGIINPTKGFKMSFSDKPFDGYQASIKLIEGGSKEIGNWYDGDICGTYMKGWLCPALYLYFTVPPENIYMRAENLPEGVNPIWKPDTSYYIKQFVAPPASKN
jgi:hypothetical protein